MAICFTRLLWWTIFSILRPLMIFWVLVIPFSKAISRPHATVLIMWSSEGDQYWGLSEDVTSAKWQQYLNEKARSDPTWPFTASIELMDVKSSNSLAVSLLNARLIDKSKSNVTVIFGPEVQMGWVTAPIAEAHGIPHMLASTNPSSTDPRAPNGTGTTFYVSAPCQYTARTMIESWVNAGVKTMAAVSYINDQDDGDVYDRDSCIAAARDIATPKSITISEFIFPMTASRHDVMDIAKKVKALDPDAVFWCDWRSYFYEDAQYRFVIPMFKELNYLPKTLSLIDLFEAVGDPVTDAAKARGDLNFIGVPSFINIALKGSDYTQDYSTPYATAFRPTETVTTVYDELTHGSLSTSPSSVVLFNDWFYNATGTSPSYQVNGNWALYDIVEGALYRATQVPSSIEDGVISPEEVLPLPYGAQTVGPYGRVIFDGNRINSGVRTIFAQKFPGTTHTTVVAPSDQMVQKFLYPMPTWDERIYEWSLTKSTSKMASIGVAAACSAVALVLMFIVVKHRNETAIRMVHHLHIAAVCFLVSVICWALALIWQDDMRQWQCDSYLWLTFLPASFLVNIINFKAYRLSVFLRVGNTKIKAGFNHMKVLKLALSCAAVTALFLLIIAFVDRPTSTRILVDEYRPKFDYHVCQSKTSLSLVLLWILVIGHILLTVACISAVRNGIEIFRDGTIIKESFMGLYACLLVAYCMHKLALPQSTIYLVRTIILCMGLLIFMLRLLISRTVTHMVPLRVIIMVVWLYRKFIKDVWTVAFPTMSTSCVAAGAGGSNHSGEEVLQLITESFGESRSSHLEDKPVFAADLPADSDIEEMLAALRNPERAKLFLAIAEKALATENVDFLIVLLQFEENVKSVLVRFSVEANKEVRTLAHEIFNRFIRANSPHEVNISSSCRASIEKKLLKWTEKDSPFFTGEFAKEIVQNDTSKRTEIFKEKAMREISLVLFQNLWRKFRATEMANQMANSTNDEMKSGAEHHQSSVIVEGMNVVNA